MTIRMILILLVLASPVLAHDEPNDQLIPGGGSEKTECMVQFFGGDLSYPPPPKPAKEWRCYDDDPTCDTDGLPNGSCAFSLGVCLNGTNHPECAPSDVASILVKNKSIGDPKYDAGLGDLQSDIAALGLPTSQQS